VADRNLTPDQIRRMRELLDGKTEEEEP
jgi:hypothetical protein